ncbi:hypothetical protein D9613_010047 [Agrocybe pediades]|uniref:Uncharacterized protein n=1 Tax=Agrocybe pediades TaxID=84607 RepID=A0A8H4QY64_9AGAR|nr:hypothetical protein D9613_010047 [Agrocybe pediades]
MSRSDRVKDDAQETKEAAETERACLNSTCLEYNFEKQDRTRLTDPTWLQHEMVPVLHWLLGPSVRGTAVALASKGRANKRKKKTL